MEEGFHTIFRFVKLLAGIGVLSFIYFWIFKRISATWNPMRRNSVIVASIIMGTFTYAIIWVILALSSR